MLNCSFTTFLTSGTSRLHEAASVAPWHLFSQETGISHLSPLQPGLHTQLHLVFFSLYGLSMLVLLPLTVNFFCKKLG